MKQFLLLAVLVGGIAFSGCASRMATYERDPSNSLLDGGKTALVISADSLHVTYVDNTASQADTLFSDSFFTQAARALLSYEVSKDFKLRKWQPNDSDSVQVLKGRGFSRLDNDITNMAHAAVIVQRLAAKYSADFVVIPYSVVIRQLSIKPLGWRHDRFGEAYDRPTSFAAKTTVHVQIWDKSGKLLYERKGKSDTGRPVLYSLLKREKNPDKDVVKYAKRFYAPPIVKSLYEAVRLAMLVRI